MFRHAHLCWVLFAIAFGACSRKEARLDVIAKALVERHARQADAEVALGHSVSHIYTREEVAGYHAKTPVGDSTVRQTWERLMAHPGTLHFGIRGNQLYLFLDNAGGVVGYYLTSQ